MDIENSEAEVKELIDIYPDDHKYLTFLKKVFRHQFRKNWFRRITTSNFEKRTTFETAFAGDEKMLANLIDASTWNVLISNHSVSIIRSYIENSMEEAIQPIYLYYMDKVFSEAIDKKETFTIGVEVIGERDPILDSQTAFMAYTTLKKIGLWDGIKVKINTFGNEKEITKYTEQIIDFYENKKHLLAPETLSELDKNPFSVFQSEIEDEQILAKSMVPITKFLKKDSKAHYERFKEYLSLLGVEYEEDHTLFLEENYYSHSMWTIEDADGDILVRGWRYDKISERLIGEKVVRPACWFSVDAEKLVALLKNKNISIRDKDTIDLYFVQLWDEAKKILLPLSLEARAAGINTMISLGTPSMKEQIVKSQRIGAKFVVLVWIMEARSWVFQVRDMINGTQEEVKKEDIIQYVIDRIGEDMLDFYAPEKDLLEN